MVYNLLMLQMNTLSCRSNWESDQYNPYDSEKTA